MGVSRKVKQPSKKVNAAKPKKESTGKATIGAAKVPKQAEGKKQKQPVVKPDVKTVVKNVKPSKIQPNTSSSPKRKAKGKNAKAAKPPEQKSSPSKTSLPTQTKRSARNAAISVSSQEKEPTLKTEANVEVAAQPSKKARNRKAQKTVANNGVNAKRVLKPNKQTASDAGEEAGQSDSKKPSAVSKLERKKRKISASPKIAKSPLKKTLGGKIVKGKKGPLSSKSTPVSGKKMKKPSKNQLKLAIAQNRGVVYFSHLPHGFYEDALKEYCGQFGVVTGVHVPRSVSGKSKGYAFVEFKHPEVAEIVAETMNNYLMHTRLIKAELVPLEMQKPWIFRNGLTSVEVAKKKKADALAARTRKLTPEEEAAHQKKALDRVKRLRKKLSDKGINLDFTVVS